MKRLFLHVGTHKTGSQSIQRFLLSNAQTLHDLGYCVMNVEDSNFSPHKAGKVPTNRTDIAHVLIRQSLKTQARYRQKFYFPAERLKSLSQAVNGVLKAIPTKNIILSSESFSFLRTSEEKRLYNIMFYGLDVIPILFLRDPQDWMRSWRNQTQRLVRRWGPEPTRGGILDYGEDSWLVDHQKIWEFFGKNTKIYSYEYCLSMHGSVLPSFLEALEIDEGNFKNMQYWHNATNKEGETV